MNVRNLLEAKRGEILTIAMRYGAFNIRLFGSVSRGDCNDKSDIDLLVSMQEGRSFLDLVGFWQDLEALLETKVDVVTERGLSPYLKDHILSEAKPL